MGLTDLDEQFTFYASYHHDKWNKLIHILCVWPILWTGLVFGEYIPFQLTDSQNPISQAIHHPINVTLIVGLLYSLCYIIMDKKAGTLAGVLVLGCVILARKFYLESEICTGYPAWMTALAIHVLCWIAQFVGHGAFEGRAPALLDNLIQAFLMAPFFVLLEVLFFFGYRKDFQKKMWAQVEKNIKKFKGKN